MDHTPYQGQTRGFQLKNKDNSRINGKKNDKNESLTIEKMAKSKKTLDQGAFKKNLMKVV